METWIYKGARKADTYLYIETEDDFSRVPQVLLDLLGDLQLVLTTDLSQRKRLAQADIEVVKSKLKDEGFYMQMPPKENALEKMDETKLEAV